MLSWESILTMFPVPEMGFRGYQLSLRSINRIYPWEAHFLAFGENVTWADFGLWIGLLGALWCVIYLDRLDMRIRASLVLIQA